MLLQKVRNWLQNHAKKTKTTRVPMHINQSFTPKRVHALKNEAKIRDAVKKVQENSPDDNRVHIVEWNNAARHMWEQLSDEEKGIYAALAEKWNEDGPEEAIKPM